MKSKDERMKVTSKVLKNMRILKLQDWEMKFLSKIQDLRSVEAGWLQRYLYASAATVFVFWRASAFNSIVIFGACMLMGIPIESGKILSALAILSIASFLSLEDVEQDIVEKFLFGVSNLDTAVEVAVCGTVGSSKSSLLSCILRDMPKISGLIRLSRTKAYVAQSECIMGLLSSKIVIYVKHQVEFLPAASLIMVMNDGKIKQSGKYNNILKFGSDFMELVGAHEEALLPLDSIYAREMSLRNSKPDASSDENDRANKTNGGVLAQAVLLAHILFQILQIGGNYWMAWATPASKDVAPHVGGSTLIIVYVALMHHCIFHALMSFFDSTPRGRILNRQASGPKLSRFERGFYNRILCFFNSKCDWNCCCHVPSCMAGVHHFHLSHCYLLVVAARKLARLYGVCKAPVIQHYSETFSGSLTIRSFDQKVRFRETGMRLIDECVAGLAVVYGLHLNMMQSWVVQSLYYIENSIISVERVLQHTCIPSEPPLVVQSNRPKRRWPI
ncbi:hypothetical protein C2S53_011552 [Perilla frutescens var. hirtella]|uniref:ABC transmembrane type-1 domain-containing protein n=1 Tax=Perilla frutescens var. hirtella TaxID=608512 RepID=A0AAD4P734_PERFH|nr:hypothetical protein C2S53_011552 [Perilla frutescens var. hirtella]